MKRFDIVTALLVLAGKLQARRVARAKARVVALNASIAAACAALPEAQKAVNEQATRHLGIGK